MTEETYEQLKAVLADNERLFTKLHKVAKEYDAIEFDESGFYHEDAERCERHWNTLASKVALALDHVLEQSEIKLLKNPEPNVCSLHFDIIDQEEETSHITRLSIDYSVEGQLSIDQQSSLQ